MTTMIITSRPSRKNASHMRSCCENGTVLTNNVMYHFVPQDVDEIMFRDWSLQPGPLSRLAHLQRIGTRLASTTR